MVNKHSLRTSTVYLTVIAGLATSTVFAQSTQYRSLETQEAAAVDAAVEEEMKRQSVVGLALGIIQDGHIVYSKGYGFEDREAQVHVTTKTMFRWACISKPLTAIVAMQLVERGKLDLDTDVRTYVPEFPDKGVKITPRQLLCH